MTMLDCLNEVLKLEPDLTSVLSLPYEAMRDQIAEMMRSVSITADPKKRRRMRLAMVFLLERLQDMESESQASEAEPLGRPACQSILEAALRAMEHMISKASNSEVSEVFLKSVKLEILKEGRMHLPIPVVPTPQVELQEQVSVLGNRTRDVAKDGGVALRLPPLKLST